MEHKLIQGGAQYLPFARSRIKAMRATGAKYASQRYVLPDATVRVQIVGQQSYIEISGGGYNILSGVVKAGQIITGTPDVLRSFKPTQQCWQYPLKKREGTSPAAFHDEPKLAIAAHANTGLSGSQYEKLCSSMYSGRMAKAVQVILGIGKQKPTDDGVQVKYDYRWARCHGIAVGPDGKSWLIEISEAEGVMAMRLPLIAGTVGLGGNTQKVLSETVKLFKGIPSGETFPVGAALTTAITEGRVLRLLSAAGLADAYGKNEFSATLGWSFNDTGSEAHNTCYTSVSGVQTSFHYRINITLGETPGATLTEVASGPLYGTARFKFYDSVANTTSFYPTTSWPGGAEQTAPVFVCHIGGVLEVVNHYSAGTGATVSSINSGCLPVQFPVGTYFTLPHIIVPRDDPLRPGLITVYMGDQDPFNFEWAEATITSSGATCIRTTRYPTAASFTRAWRVDQTQGFNYDTDTYAGTPVVFPYTERRKVERHVKPPSGMMLRGVRDGYAFREQSESRTTVTADCYAHVAPGSPPYVGVGFYEVGTPATALQQVTNSAGGWPQPTAPVETRTVESGPWFDQIRIVTSAEVSSIRQDYVDQAAADAADVMWSTTVGICDARVSTFGETKHLLYSAPVLVTDFNAVLSGPMLTTETNPSATKYSFVGYI